MEISLIIFILGFSSCQGMVGNATDDLKNLMDDYYDWLLMEYPESATYYGENKWNSKRESFNLTVIPQRKAALERYFASLIGIDRHELSKQNQLNYDVLRDTLKTYINGYAWFKYGAINPINFLEGEQTDPGFMPSVFPLRRRDDFEDYISRMIATKTQLEEYVEQFREAIRLGRTLHAISIDSVPSQIESLLVDDVTQSVYYSPFNEALDELAGVTDTAKEELRRRAESVIQDNILTPYRDLKTFLEQEYLPATRQSWGVSAWDNGRDYYDACLKWHLSQNVTALEIHQRGLDEVDRISTRMTNLMRKGGFNGTIPEYFEYLKSDPKFSFSSGEDIVQAYEDILFNRTIPQLKKFFSDLPDSPVVVRSFSSDGPLVGFSPAREDGSSPAVLWVNVMKPNETYSYEMMVSAAHYIYPGRHLRRSYSNQIPIPAFRANSFSALYSVPFTPPAYSAYTQGWALYGESLAEDMGLYEDDSELMSRYSWEILRACRLVVDTGLHYYGWSKERAIQYILSYTSSSRSEIESELDRYLTWPGQACSYKFGELKIWELRKKAERILGDRFDIKEFHSTILDLGASPLHIMDKSVNDMIIETFFSMVSDTTVTQSAPWTLLLSSLLVFALTALKV